MEELIDRITPGSRRSFMLGFGLAMTVLAVTIFAGLLYVRSTVRAQIVSRDAEALYATTMMEQLDAAATYSGALEDDQLAMESALLASRLRGVIGIRFFDVTGKFKDAFPANIQPSDLKPWGRKVLNARHPSGVLQRDVPLDQVFIYLPSFATGNVARANILQVAIPLHSSNATNQFGAAEFVLEGESIASEYSKLDRQVVGIGAAALLVGGILLGGMLWPVFYKAQRLNRDLEAQYRMLQRANAELALAARASALGAVSAHLMHGLKNPLASLSEFLRDRIENDAHIGSGEQKMAGNDGADALNAARRIQSMVNETLEVLADARGEPGYQISPAELVESIREKAGPIAARKGVKLIATVNTPAHLPSHVANLARLILANLVDNAIDVTPPEGIVSISAEQEESHLQRFIVKDQGPGLPAELRQKLFLPCTSSSGGSGLGLAISHRLAEHLGAKLSLKSSSGSGCVFELELPLEAILGGGR